MPDGEIGHREIEQHPGRERDRDQKKGFDAPEEKIEHEGVGRMETRVTEEVVLEGLVVGVGEVVAPLLDDLDALTGDRLVGGDHGRGARDEPVEEIDVGGGPGGLDEEHQDLPVGRGHGRAQAVGAVFVDDVGEREVVGAHLQVDQERVTFFLLEGDLLVRGASRSAGGRRDPCRGAHWSGRNPAPPCRRRG